MKVQCWGPVWSEKVGAGGGSVIGRDGANKEKYLILFFEASLANIFRMFLWSKQKYTKLRFDRSLQWASSFLYLFVCKTSFIWGGNNKKTPYWMFLVLVCFSLIIEYNWIVELHEGFWSTQQCWEFWSIRKQNPRIKTPITQWNSTKADKLQFYNSRRRQLLCALSFLSEEFRFKTKSVLISA